ncbi:GHMP family kinase (homolog to beta-ribofuranosylaminobenzene 5'-phosphate synthase) [Natrialba magadii ATCC 43099]|uniref:Beta-ribofuranosylaminobenzene 5'-phosphate synthase n=1 Tax=Natrialba magadii (strain ATCC 43099 / DSM 3394 / CCM 3739 / CIP 104546 / IAM 13178 / JCM 8861 / NBRC 102185 / NCIMB 2190 / MS3) TaxID=547559 RepID=D3SYV1_NATMM|nr:beta-ribofuranosylaminobenzene 5'-phosphate synthase family protein [Natrialba magadii]ADD04212.1 GHMP family kinase (homolog to beta-ribofuranosylaminobenzene 5'-phosphate synthase) [Natrialba magadii ATCC 43099]ELY26615.1 beta-ribofuranosylaminobenzene 5'-phosphate synthase family protein [Natrialba magadii ATCC 43099]
MPNASESDAGPPSPADRERGVTVSAGARLHVGFQNLSLARERLYGGIGIGLETPRVTVTAARADEIAAADPLVRDYAVRAVDVLDVPGIQINIEERLPRHVGLGSGTQLALAVLAATAHAYDLEPRVRTNAPAMGRGGRSGIGVATFENGGFVVDAGHPTNRFTTAPPDEGDWTVPPVVARHDLPDDWRFLVVVPDADPGRSGTNEDASMRTVVERADPAIADELAGVVTRKLLPAAAAGRLEAFGEAIREIGRKNGAWYTDAQGGVFRPPAGELVEALESCPVLSGIGQSSWGPVVYGVTDRGHAEEAVAAAEDALAERGLSGEVLVSCAATTGATVKKHHLRR